MRDALANIRLAFVEIKARRDRVTATGLIRRTGSGRSRGRRRRGRRARMTPSARSRRGLAGGRRRGQAAVAAHDAPPRQVDGRSSASSAPTARDRPGNPASSATSP